MRLAMTKCVAAVATFAAGMWPRSTSAAQLYTACPPLCMPTVRTSNPRSVPTAGPHGKLDGIPHDTNLAFLLSTLQPCRGLLLRGGCSSDRICGLSPAPALASAQRRRRGRRAFGTLWTRAATSASGSVPPIPPLQQRGRLAYAPCARPLPGQRHRFRSRRPSCPSSAPCAANLSRSYTAPGAPAKPISPLARGHAWNGHLCHHHAPRSCSSAQQRPANRGGPPAHPLAAL